MNASSPRRSRWLILLTLLLVLSALIPGATLANDPPPPPKHTADRQPAPAQNDEVVTDNSATATLSEEQPASDQGASAQPTAAAPSTFESFDAAPTATDSPGASAVSPSVQGVVTLDVSVPDSIRAGEYITYTYAYANNSGSTATGVVVKAIWTNFSTNVNGNWQFCPGSPDVPTNCDILPGSIVGPTVTPNGSASASNGSGFRIFNVGNLAPGQSGQFAVRLRTKRDIYPKTNQAISRPAGSGQLFLNGSSIATSDDTAATIVIGPVLALKKTTDTTLKLYPLETAEYVINVGNATGTQDSTNGQIRADARPATNVIVTDIFPAGGDFVSATGNPTVNSSAKTVTWVIPGPLNPGQSVDLHVTFKKLDVNSDCPRLNNATYYATSDEYPFNGANRYTVSGPGVSVPVITPLVVKSIVSNPASAPYGAGGEITIVVQNFWNQSLNGIQLNYAIQSNAMYNPGSASPAPSSVPPANTLGGVVSWTFNIGAGSKTVPTEMTFVLSVQGDYTSNVQAGTGRATIFVPPALNVPSACILSKDGRLNLIARLKLTKYTDADPATKINADTYGVHVGDKFPYIIDVTNSGPTDATNVQVNDVFPSQQGANFSYVPGSGSVGGVQQDPNSITNGNPGGLVWTGLTIHAGETLRIRYQLNVDGIDYVRYCNTATATSGSESIAYGARSVCVKISPNIVVTKTANKTTANPGEQVQFTLSLTNNENQSYHVGLVDFLNDFTYVPPVAGGTYPGAPTLNGKTLTWPLIDLAAHTSVTAIINATVPNICTTKDYINEVIFYDAFGYIYPTPRVQWKVRVNCGKIEYSKSVDRSPISLGDRHTYTLQIRNADGNPASNVPVVDILPQGFTYVGLDPSSSVKTNPTQQTTTDGRIKLTWTIPSIPANTTTNIKFIARSGAIVGTFNNWLTVPVGGKCVAFPSPPCYSDPTDGTVYYWLPVTVQPFATMEPKITDPSCAQPGDLRTYQLTIVNTNNHDYTSTVVSVTLPLGLKYVSVVGSTPSPTVGYNSTGGSTVRWEGLRIPAKPSNAVASQVVLAIQLKVGQVWGNLDTLVQTSSPDGLIPRKDGFADPTVPVCATSSAIAKDVSRSFARIGDELIYQISLANTTAATVTATIEDQLPNQLTFVQAILGPAPLGPAPTVNGNTLTWAVDVPPAINGVAGSLILQFRVRVVGGAPGEAFTNTATANPASAFPDTTYDSVSVIGSRAVFLPLVAR